MKGILATDSAPMVFFLRWLLKAAINTAIFAALIVVWYQATTRFIIYWVQDIEPILKPWIIWATNNGDQLNTTIIVAVLIQLYLIFLVGLWKFYRWWNRVAPTTDSD